MKECEHATHTFINTALPSDRPVRLWLDEEALAEGEAIGFDGADEQCVDCGGNLLSGEDSTASLRRGCSAVVCKCGAVFPLEFDECEVRL